MTLPQANVQDLATQVQQLQEEVHSMELKQQHSAAQVQALSDYISRACSLAQSRRQGPMADKQQAGQQVSAPEPLQ